MRAVVITVTAWSIEYFFPHDNVVPINYRLCDSTLQPYDGAFCNHWKLLK